MRLSARLAAIAQFVRPGVILCDVGTDHAYIPVALTINGTIERAVASDINDGPVARARANVSANHMENKIDIVQTDGLRGLESYSPDDIIIAGMGGELICDIINASHIPRNNSVNMILQPMTMQSTLRQYLYHSGFYIIDEALVEDGKIYNIICANYKPDNRELPYTQLELIVGRRLIVSQPPLFKRYINGIINITNTKIAGMERANLNTSSLHVLSSQLEALIN